MTLLLIFYTFFFPADSLIVIAGAVAVRPFLITLNPVLKGILDAWLFGLFVLIVWRARERKLHYSAFPKYTFEWFYLAFCAWGFFIGWENNVTLHALLFQVHAFLIPYLVFYTASRVKELSEWSVYRYLWVLVAIGVCLTPQAFLEKISRRHAGLPFDWRIRPLSPENANRIYGMMDNPNTLAYFLGLSILAAGLLLEMKRRKGMAWPYKRIILYVSLVLMIGVFIMTQSRGAILSFGLAVIVSTFISRIIRFPIRLVMAGLMAVFLVILPFQLLAPVFDEGGFSAHIPFQVSDRMTQHYENTFDGSMINQSMNSGRLWVLEKGLAIWYDHPILGTGFGTFGDSAAYAVGSPLQKSYQLPRLMYADNQYIEVLVETGIAGSVLFAGFLIGLMGFLWKKRKALKLRGQLIGLMLGAILAGFYYSIWEMLPFTFTIFLLLAFYEKDRLEYENQQQV